MDFKKDYYHHLGLDRKATAVEIKTAYRSLAKQYHPDLHPGDKDRETRMREINEAYDVLGNEESRLVYDQFRDHLRAQATSPPNKNQRKYTRTETVTHTERYYVTGTIFIKYRGSQNNQLTDDVLREVTYDMRFTEVRVTLPAENIYRAENRPEDFDRAFQGTKLSLNLEQPISCEVISGNSSSHYRLEIFDLTIPHLAIDGVTKEDGDSFGRLSGRFFGYIKKIIVEKVDTEVTECYGPSGRKEEKKENNIAYFRDEYYHTDCTTYWGPWTRRQPANSPRRATNMSNQSRYKNGQTLWTNYRKTYAPAAGCAGSTFQLFGLLLVGGFLLFSLPSFWPILLVFLLVKFFSLRFWTGIVRMAGFLAGFLFLLAIAGVLWQKPRPAPQADRPEERRVRIRPVKGHPGDSLISHFRSWNDYDGRTYHGSLAVLKSAVVRSADFKANLDMPVGDEAGYDRLLSDLEAHDQKGMNRLYGMLDSIRRKDTLREDKFAEVIVAMVQDIPYSLVLPRDCNPALYKDRFISDYLQRPNARCDGNERFGINAPAEFLATLNGDCDTRTLLVYTILQHYRYDVALLSSEYYNHSLIGINLPYQGTAYADQGKNYYLWETTTLSPPGLLSGDVADLNYWRISLKSIP